MALKNGAHLSLATRVVRDEDILTTDIDDETMMASFEMGNYYGANRTGSLIWKELSEPRAVSDLRDVLMARFDVDETRCTEKLLEFLHRMLEEKLIRVVDK